MVKFKKIKKKNITINNKLYSTSNSLDSVRNCNDDIVTTTKTTKEEPRTAAAVTLPDRDIVADHEIVNSNAVVDNSNSENNTNNKQIKEENDDDDKQREAKRNIINNGINNDSSNDVDNYEDTEEGDSYYNTIQSFQKKQRLKKQIRSHKKYITPQSQQQATAKKNSNVQLEKEKVIQEANRDLKDRLEGTFSSSLSSSSKNKINTDPLGDHDDDYDDDEDEDGGILRRKHKLAMEQFIQSEMQTILQSKAAPEAGLNNNNNDNTTVDNNGIDNSINTNTKLQSENDLYVQLLSNATNIQSSLQEGDVGAGGAILGGTGIAEVVLPVEERIQTVKETEIAALQKGLFFRTNKHYKPTLYGGDAHTSNQTHDEDDLKHLLPMSFGQGPGKKRQRPSAAAAATTTTSLETLRNDSNLLTTPNTTSSFTGSNIVSSHHQDMPSSVLASSYSHNFRLHNSEWIANRKRDQEKEEEMEAMKRKRMDVDQVYDSNRTRIGFDSRKNKDSSSSVIGGGSSKNDYTPNASSGNPHGNRSRGNNNDDRLWKSFVTKQRERGGRG